MTVTRNARILGNKLGFSIAGKDYWSDISSYELAPETSDKDVVTFADALSGASSAWKLKGKAIVSFDAGSFWDMLWQQAGRTVEVLVAPFGNKVATAKQPHFKIKAKIGVKPSISSEAGDEKGSTGSSPLTRGKPRAEVRLDGLNGLIPTHAGKTRMIFRASALHTAHPHSRGENRAFDVLAVGRMGSSPLTRGKPLTR